VDTLKHDVRATTTKRMEPDDDTILHEAPVTLLQGDMLTEYERHEYVYKPKFKEMPTIKLDKHLNIGGIYNMEDGFSSDEDSDQDEFVMPTKGTGIKRKIVAPEMPGGTIQQQ
jgi:hypothetical protein